MAYRSVIATGIATVAADGRHLDSWYPSLGLASGPVAPGMRRLALAEAVRRLEVDERVLRHDPVRDVSRVAFEIGIPDFQQPIASINDAFLRLHLVSLRLVRPNEVSFAGLAELADHDVAWTSMGPCRPSRLPFVRMHAQARGVPFLVRSVFPLPPMLDYVCPSGVTIADGSQVLLGAHLAPGTMVTPAGSCNFNAGTLGACMIEGRISAGVVVGDGSHVGGGASLMGSLSGGGRRMIRVGQRCLIGANAGIGISLGDDCLVEAGCYVTAGSLVRLADGTSLKAADLSGRPELVFRRNSTTGALEAIRNTGRWCGLNPVFHPHRTAG